MNEFASDDQQLQLHIQCYKWKLTESFPGAKIETYLESKQQIKNFILAMIKHFYLGGCNKYSINNNYITYKT